MLYRNDMQYVEDMPTSMSLAMAEKIRRLKKTCTYSRLAEVLIPIDDPDYGCQLTGKWLCEDAFKVLYPHLKMHEIKITTCDGDFLFANKSYVGDFFWWE